MASAPAFTDVTSLATQTVTTADVTLTEAKMEAGYIVFSGLLTGNRSVIFPAAALHVGESWLLRNCCTGPYDLTVKCAGQPGHTLNREETARMIFNGTDLQGDHPEALPRRYELRWEAGARGLPQLSAVTQPPGGDTYNTAAMLALLNADREFEILGVNAISADVTLHPEGGIKLLTKAGGLDSIILLPHLTAGQSPWTFVTWGSDQQVIWEAEIKTGPVITACAIWAGLKATNTPVAGFDDNQAFFKYEAGINAGKWSYYIANDGADDLFSITPTVEANTRYHLAVRVDSARVARGYINGEYIGGSALKDATDLIPYIGIIEGEAGAKTLYVYGQSVSRGYA